MEGLPAAKKTKRQLSLASTAMPQQPRLSPSSGMFKLKPQNHQQQPQHHQQHQPQVYYLFQQHQHSHVVVNPAQQPRLVRHRQQQQQQPTMVQTVAASLPPVQFFQQQQQQLMSQQKKQQQLMSQQPQQQQLISQQQQQQLVSQQQQQLVSQPQLMSQQQQLMSQQQRQVLHQRLSQPQAVATSPRLQVRPKRLEDLTLPSDELQASAPSTAPWTTTMPVSPVSLTMPLHAVPPMAAPHSVGYPSTAMRRMGAKRVPGPDDWRLNSSRVTMNAVKFMSTSSSPGSPSSGGGSFGLPPRLSPASATCLNPRSSPVPTKKEQETEQKAARVAALDKRRAKIRQLAAFYEAECEAYCQRILVLQQELGVELGAAPEVADECIKRESSV